MKSIKEKAEEYAEFLSDSLKMESPLYRARMNSFEAGANYVLEQIEKLINNQNWCAFPKQSHKELKELIEQLKGNQ